MATDLTDRAEALAEVIEKADVFSLPALGVPGEAQVEAVFVVGTVTEPGSLSVTVTAAGMANSPKTLLVPVLEGQSSYTVADAVRLALNADLDISGFFNIGGVGVNVELIAKTAANNDPTMNLAVLAGTSQGILDAPASLTNKEGQAADLSKIEAILNRYKRATRWVAGAAVQVGPMKILPLTPNGRMYRVVKGGTFGLVEPFTETSYVTQDRIFDNGVILEDAGPAGIDNVYDINQVIIALLEAKLAQSLKFTSTEGLNMSKITDNIQRALEYYQVPLLG